MAYIQKFFLAFQMARVFQNNTLTLTKGLQHGV